MRLIIVLGLLMLLLIQGCVSDQNAVDEKNVPSVECTVDADCIPATCCHAESCVPIDQKPDCFDTLCTMECVPGTTDCGAGRCGCINNKCDVVWKNVG